MKKFLLQLLITCIIFVSAKAEIINDVKLENNIRVSKESIIAFGNIKFGKDYSESAINQILVDLYNTNFFLPDVCLILEIDSFFILFTSF